MIAGLAALLRGSPARKRLFEVTSDNWRARITPDALRIIRVKRAVLDILLRSPAQYLPHDPLLRTPTLQPM
jgi:hypothetical protein